MKLIEIREECSAEIWTRFGWNTLHSWIEPMTRGLSKYSKIVILAALLVALSACSQALPPPQVSAPAKKHMKRPHVAGHGETKFGRRSARIKLAPATASPMHAARKVCLDKSELDFTLEHSELPQEKMSANTPLQLTEARAV